MRWELLAHRVLFPTSSAAVDRMKNELQLTQPQQFAQVVGTLPVSLARG